MVSSYHMSRILNVGGFFIIIFWLLLITIAANWIHIEYSVRQRGETSRTTAALLVSPNWSLINKDESSRNKIMRNGIFFQTLLQKDETFPAEIQLNETFSKNGAERNESFNKNEKESNIIFYNNKAERNEAFNKERNVTFNKNKAERKESFNKERNVTFNKNKAERKEAFIKKRNVTFSENETDRKESFSDYELQNNETFFGIETPRNETFSIDKNSFVRCIKQKLLKTVNLDEGYDPTVLKRHPNLPLFLISSKILSKLIPPIYRIRWSGTVYQESWKEHPKCLLYSANFDSRLPDGLVIRIISLCEERRTALNSFCQFWYNETESPVTSPIYESGFPGIFVSENYDLKASMLTCKVPLEKNVSRFPIAVSIVKSPCAVSTNILKIGGSPLPRNDTKLDNKNLKIGLCGKALFFYNSDFSSRLIEWIEILKLLGVSQFFLYKTPCHKNVEKVLDYYERKGVVKVLSFHFPSPFVYEGTFTRLWTHTNYGQFNSIQRVFYNDCIQRYKDDFDHIAIFDYDEIPILRKHKTLQDFLNFVKSNNRGAEDAAAVGLRWKIHYSQFGPSGPAVNVSKDLYIVSHNVRSPINVTFHYSSVIKSIYNTRKVLYVNCHSPVPFRSIPPLSAIRLPVNIKLAYTAHFRTRHCNKNCVEKGFEEENRLLEYKDEIKKQMNIVRKEIELHKK